MKGDHDEIERVFDQLVSAARDGDREEVAALFTILDRRLDAHLALEDEVLLPALHRAYPDEADALAAEHCRIRARLIELGVCIDLHLARATWVADFVELLRAHARREDALLYRWSETPGARLDPEAVSGGPGWAP